MSTTGKTATRFISILLCLCLLSGLSAMAETPKAPGVLEEIRSRGVLRVGTAGDYKPMSFRDPETGTYWGFDTELAEDLAASLGVGIEYVPTSWPTLMEDTLAGKFDLAVCGITVTDARKEQALMSEGYLQNGKTVLCRAEDTDRYTSLEAINRPEVRVMENPGGLNEKFARENLPDAALIIHDVNQEIPGLVASGEADVMITEVMEAGYYVGQDSRLAAPLIYEPFTEGQLGVLMPKGSEDLLEYVNQFLAKEKADGRLDELAEKYIYRYIRTEEQPEGEPSYTLDRVVMLSRHNIRSPLSGSGSLLGEITPHEWFAWTSGPSELSLRGAVSETMMGQYFRLWLEQESLIPENWQPEKGAVRFYANAKQRTLATARYFSAGLLPVAVVPVESHAAYDTMDPVFDNALNFATEEYVRDALEQIASRGGEAGLDGILANLNDAISKMMDTADIEKSEAYQSGKYGDLKSGEIVITLEEGTDPKMTGPIKNATSVADAMTFQYYEEADEKKAAFGHDLSMEDWQLIHSIVDEYTKMLFCSPLVSVNIAHPLLEELRSEMSTDGRKFSFLCGHDANIASVLAAINAEEYLLPDTVEQDTPIGVKLMFERWVSESGEAFWKVSLVYQSTAQLRALEQLSLENPPVKYPVRLKGVEAGDDGMIREADLFAVLDGAINAYDELLEQYAAEEEKAA